MKRLPIAGDLSPPTRSTERAVVRLGARGDQRDRVVVEEPLEIRLAGESIAVTMRTPGDDFDLAVGFLYTEGVLASIADVAGVGWSTRAEDRERRNIVEVTPSPLAEIDPERAKRSFYAASSCGVCGKSTIDAIHVRVSAITRAEDPAVLTRARLMAMPEAMRRAQATFDSTGGLHAAAIFDAAAESGDEPRVVREDIGRHNATDKVIGHLVRTGAAPLRGGALMVSGRAGFEIVQKAAVARIPVVAAVSAPSSLAIDLAERLGVTLVAFLRPPEAGIYTHPWRIAG